MIRSHVARCSDCQTFEQRVRAFARELRAAPLEPPSRPIAVSRPAARRPHWRAQQAIAQAGIAAMIVVGVLGLTSQAVGPELRPGATSQPAQSLFEASWQPDVEQAQLPSDGPKRWRVGERTGELFIL